MPSAKRHLAVLGATLLALTGCASIAPKYTSIPAHVTALRDAGLQPVNVGLFTSDDNRVNHLTIRGGEYQSPYQSSYVLYLREALQQELDDARLVDPKSTCELSGVLVKNELNAAGFVTADAQIQARFVVKREGQVRYDETKTSKHEWESSFIGAIAIPRAQQNYPVAVQRLLADLFSDPKFIAALKP